MRCFGVLYITKFHGFSKNKKNSTGEKLAPESFITMPLSSNILWKYVSTFNIFMKFYLWFTVSVFKNRVMQLFTAQLIFTDLNLFSILNLI